MRELFLRWAAAAIVGMLAACSSVPLPPLEPLPSPAPAAVPDAAQAPLPPPRVTAKSRWVPVRWQELPGFHDDALHEAWNAWLTRIIASVCTHIFIRRGYEYRPAFHL